MISNYEKRDCISSNYDFFAPEYLNVIGIEMKDSLQKLFTIVEEPLLQIRLNRFRGIDKKCVC